MNLSRMQYANNMNSLAYLFHRTTIHFRFLFIGILSFCFVHSSVPCSFAATISDALDTSGRSWESYLCYASTQITHDNIDAARCLDVTGHMETEINGPATISFWAKKSSTSNTTDCLAGFFSGETAIIDSTSWQQYSLDTDRADIFGFYIFKSPYAGGDYTECNFDQVSITYQQPAPCTYSISPATYNFSKYGGGGTIDLIKSAPTCSTGMTANAGQDGWYWLAPFNSASQKIQYFVDANRSYKPRSGKIIVKNHSFTVTQDGDYALTFVPYHPASSSENSVIMMGGKAYRYYRVLDALNDPLVSTSLRYQYNGAGPVFTTTTDDAGIAKIETDWMFEGGKLDLKVILPNGAINTEVSATPSFFVELKDREFNQEWSLLFGANGTVGLGGPSLSAGPLQFETARVGLEAGLSTIMKLLYNIKGNENTVHLENEQEETLEASASGGVFGKLAWGGKAKPKIDVGVTAGIGYSGSTGASYRFPGFMDASRSDHGAQVLAAAAFFLENAVASLPQSPVGTEKVLSWIIGKISGVENYREGINTENSLGGYARGGAAIEIENPIGTTPGGTLGVSLLNFDGEMVFTRGAQEKVDGTRNFLFERTASLNSSLFDVKLGSKFGDQRKKGTPAFDLNLFSYAKSIEGSESVRVYRTPENEERGLSLQRTISRSSSTAPFISESTEKNFIVEIDNARVLGRLKSNSETYAQITSSSSMFTPFFVDQLYDDAVNSTASDTIDWHVEREDKEFVDLSFDFEIGLGLKAGLGLKIKGMRSLSFKESGGFVSSDRGMLQTEGYWKDNSISASQKTVEDFTNVFAEAISNALSDFYTTISGYIAEGVRNAGASIKGAWVDCVAYISTPQNKSASRIVALQGYSEAGTTDSYAKAIGNLFIVNLKDPDGNLVSDFSTSPLELTMDYTDSMLLSAGIDPMQAPKLAIYRWEGNSCAYTYQASTVDTANKKVVANIDKPGQFMLAIVEAPPEISVFKASNNTPMPLISAEIRGLLSGIDTDSLVFKIDDSTMVNGVNLGDYYDKLTGTFKYLVTTPLIPGIHTAGLTAISSAGNQTVSSKISFMINSLAPVIVHVPIVSADSGGNLAVYGTITDDTAVLRAVLHYKPDHPDHPYALQEMTLSGGDTYTAQIPDHAMTSLGISYYISAEDIDGNEASIPAKSVVVTDKTGPSKPAGLTAIQMDGKLLLTWQPVNHADVAGYRIYHGESGTNLPNSIDVGNVTSVTISVPAPYLAVVAYDVDGLEGVRSDVVAGTLNTWKSLAQFGRRINAIAIAPGNSQLIYVGAAGNSDLGTGGVLKSIDGGTTWVEKNNGLIGLTDLNVKAIAIDPNNSDIIFAGTYYGGIFKSLDGGHSWKMSLPGSFGEKIALEPQDSQTVYAAVNGSIFKSKDGGETWADVGNGGTDNFDLAQNQNQTLFAGGVGRIYKTLDGGDSWTSVYSKDYEIFTTIAIDPKDSMTVYAGTPLANPAYLYKTIDGGVSWSECSIDTGFSALAIDPSNNQRVIAAGSDGRYYLSLDGGTTWGQLGAPIPSSTVLTLSIDPNNSEVTYVGTDSGLFKQNGIYGTLRLISSGLTENKGIRTLVIDQTDSRTIYAGEFSRNLNGGVYKSIDGGLAWSSVNSGLGFMNDKFLPIKVLLMSPVNSDVLYSLNFRGDLYKSTDAAKSWKYVYGSGYFYSIAVDPGNSEKIYAGGASFKISTNGGSSWIQSDNGIEGQYIYSIVVDPIDGRILYAGTGNGGVFKSFDGGASWTAVNNGLASLAIDTLVIDRRNGQTLYAINDEGKLFKSVNGGTSWGDDLTNFVVNKLVIDPGNNLILYAGTAGNGLFRSIDGGISWKGVNSGLSDLHIRDVVVDPSDSAKVYVTTGDGIYKVVFGDVGVCGLANGGSFSSTPGTNLCSTGDASSMTGRGPWSWSCSAEVGGAASSCTAHIYSYQVAFRNGPNGSLVGNLSQPVSHGASTSQVVALPNPGYHFVNWTGPGGFASSANPLMVSNVTADISITAHFADDPTNGACGASDSGVFTAMPTADLCGDASLPALSGTGPWTWTCAGGYGGADASCSATIQTCRVTFTSGGNGTLTGSGVQTVNYGTSTSEITAIPAAGYHFVNWTGLGGGAGATNNPLTVSNVVATMTITANFAADPVNGACGSSNGGTFNIAPTSNLCSTGTESLVTGGGPWHWSCGASDGGIDASCSANVQGFMVTFSGDANGTVICASPVNYGADSVCSIVPSAGYQLVAFTDNGVDAMKLVTNGSYDISKVSTSHSVVATFGAVKAGDCDKSGVVAISEVQVAINMFLGIISAATCVDLDVNGHVNIYEVQKAINAFLGL